MDVTVARLLHSSANAKQTIYFHFCVTRLIITFSNTPDNSLTSKSSHTSGTHTRTYAHTKHTKHTKHTRRVNRQKKRREGALPHTRAKWPRLPPSPLLSCQARPTPRRRDHTQAILHTAAYAPSRLAAWQGRSPPTAAARRPGRSRRCRRRCWGRPASLRRPAAHSSSAPPPG